MSPTPRSSGAEKRGLSPFSADRGESLLGALPSLVHDLRGPVTAAGVFCQILEAEAGAGADAALQPHVEAVRANLDLLAHLTDGLALLSPAGKPMTAPASEVLLETVARWQKILSRGHVALNLSGEIPDTPVERRALRVALGSLMNVLVAAAAGSPPATVTLSAVPGGRELNLDLDCEAGGEGACCSRLPEVLEEATKQSEFSGLVLQAALHELGATVHAATCGEGGGRLTLRLKDLTSAT